ncbi:MAG: alpha-hydroxy-acid oxidizing protein [Pseudomonadota bacterium]
MDDIRKRARERMKGYCRVCPVCNGVACAGEVPGMGGLGTASSFKANVAALAAERFNMRLIHGVGEPDTRVTVLGGKLALPVLAAPIGGVEFNMGGSVSEQDYIRAIILGCHEKGILGCTGDGVPAFIHASGFNAIREAGGAGIPFIKPWEEVELFEKMEKAEATGATIWGIDIDAAGLVTLKKMGRPVTPRDAAALSAIIGRTPMKCILKGIMTPDEARLAVDAGAHGIVVSNHGGRVMDHTPGVAEVLPAVSAAVKGQIAVLADGGVRTGGDVLKMLALGADAVMIGRPFAVAAVGGQQPGVATYIDTLRGELIQAMVLTGTASVVDVSPRVLYR